MSLTVQQIRQREYWKKRERAQRETYMLTEEQTNKQIEQIYAEMQAWADTQINAFYGKYADAEGITLAEAKKRVSKMDIDKYEKLAEQYVKDKDFSDRANEEMRLYNATMKINRLELLKAQMGLGLVDGADRLDKLMEDSLTQRAAEEMVRQSGILGKTVTDADTIKRAKQIVNADFYNATFSDRIWGHADNLRDEIAVQLNQGLIAGVSSRVMAQRLKDRFDVSLKDAQRLAVTELRRVQTDVARDSYIENDIDSYEFMAVNPNACPICKAIDGNIYPVKDMTIGENAPPMHPRCHCTTAPAINEDEYEAWLNYLEQGGSTAEWDALPEAERQRWIEQAKMSPAERQNEPDNDILSTKDAFIPAKTIAEAEEYARSLGLEAWYKGVDLDMANDMNRAVRRALDLSAHATDKMGSIGLAQTRNKNYKKDLTEYLLNNDKYIQSLRDSGASEGYLQEIAKSWAGRYIGRIPANCYAFASHNNKMHLYDGIYVNKKWASSDAMTVALQRDELSKFHPANTATPLATFDHEMGHQLDYALGLRDLDEMRNLYYRTSEKAIREGLSEYANKNIAEFIAEGYCEYMNSPDPRPLAQEIGRIIEERAHDKG